MKVLIAPLDWGLGHATRSLPLAWAMEALGHEILIASSGSALSLLRQALPGRPWRELPAYGIDYRPSPLGFTGTMLRQAPAILKAIAAEHRDLLQWADSEGVQAILSDGRYGIWHERIPSILITHQLCLLPPRHFPAAGFWMGMTERLNRMGFRHFQEVWVPDGSQAPGLSGRLGHRRRRDPKIRYLGPMNRFAWIPEPAGRDETTVIPDILAIISGPEPQRGALEKELIGQLAALPGTRILIQGLPASSESPRVALGESLVADELTVLPHLSGAALRGLLRRAKSVITRSGYTSVMELAGLAIKPVLMVPTPGQTEQEYLARQLAAGGYIQTQRQGRIDLASILPQLARLPGLQAALPPGELPGMSREGLLQWLRLHPLFQPDGNGYPWQIIA